MPNDVVSILLAVIVVALVYFVAALFLPQVVALLLAVLVLVLAFAGRTRL